MNYIYLDIETIPDQREGAKERAIAGISAPGNYKDPAKIAAYIEGKADEAWRKTALDGGTGEVWCAGYAHGNEGALCVDRADGLSEHMMINLLLGRFDFGPVSTPNTFVGHNIRGFDLPFLWQRCWAHGLNPIGILPHPNDRDRVYDTMTDGWAFGNRTADKRRSLDHLCYALGVPTPKGDMDGSKVWDAISAGEHQKVIDYNKADVEATRAIHRKMCFIE